MTPAQHQALVDDLVRDEGIRLKPYLDTVGKATIGVGRNLSDVGISQAEAMVLLEWDIGRAEQDARTFGWFEGLDPVRQRAVLNLLFNLGLSRFVLFRHFIAAMGAKLYDKAGDELQASVWYGQVGDRAKRLVAMIRTGDAG
jgi:lysozyme